LQSLLCFSILHSVSDGGIPRPDAGYFALGGKVTKTPLKPLRFQPSRFTKAGNWLDILFSALAQRKGESFAPLARSYGGKNNFLPFMTECRVLN